MTISGSGQEAGRLLPDSPTDGIIERRTNTRFPTHLHACLVPLSMADEIRCETDDVGEDGIHVTVPVGYGVAVGQRYEVQLAAPGATLGMGPLLTSPGQFATVVRTSLDADATGGSVGVGLRLDAPLPPGVC
ncbi:MAG TPA: hypothetical protein P5572_01440 [Phycisphaerae bacterium]|nr:hypothetical protein [Phycisphaerae bacterium]